MNNPWFTVSMLGNLYCKEIYCFYDEPQVFLLEDEAHKLFLTTCIDSGQWILSAISKEKLTMLKKNLFPVRDIITKPEEGYVYLLNTEKSGEITCVKISPDKIKEENLPTPDECLNCSKQSEIAEKIGAVQYGWEPSKELSGMAKELGCIIVFGASDDLCEMRGLIDDESQ